MKFLLALFLFAASSALCFGQPHNLVTNLQYRLSQGDLGYISPGPFENTRTLSIQEGGTLLLQECQDHPLDWRRDPMFFRLAHRHAASTISCRERTSPSMHVVFYPLADGSLETRIHFDLHGPQNPIGHLGEVVRNRLTFGRTSEYEVYRGLVKKRGDPDTPVPPPAYDFRSHASEFYKAAFGPGAFAGAAFGGVAAALTGRGSYWGDDVVGRYENYMKASLARNVLSQSIAFGAGAALQQEQRFATSHEQQLGRRARFALTHSLMVPGRGGDELAFPRIAAAIGTGWITHEWHPGCQRAPNPWTTTAILLSKYVLLSYWHEFQPEIRHGLEKGRRMLDRSSPERPDSRADSATND